MRLECKDNIQLVLYCNAEFSMAEYRTDFQGVSNEGSVDLMCILCYFVSVQK